MDKIDYTVLISKSVIQELSQEEQAELNCWLEKSEGHRKIYQEITEKHFTAEQIALYSQERADKAFQKFVLKRKLREQSQEKRWRSRLARYAAVVLIFIASGIFIYYYNRGSEYQILRPVKITELSQRNKIPVLILSDGKKQELDSHWIQLKEKDGSQIIRGKEGELVYIKGQDSTTELIYNTVMVPRMCDYHLFLSDGTEVWLNAESELKYPVSFSASQRTVYVKGEAYFKVKKDVNRPFFVMMDEMNIKVLGTAFNVCAYTNELYTRVTLAEGSVAAFTGDQSVTLLPDQQLSYDRANRKMEVQQVDVADYTCWKDGYYIFKHRTLGEVAKIVTRWYNVEIIFRRESDANTIYTGVIYKEEDITGFARRLRTISGCDCKLIGNKLYIE